MKEMTRRDKLVLMILVAVVVCLLIFYIWKPYASEEVKEAYEFIEWCEKTCGDMFAFANLTERPWICRCVRSGWEGQNE